MKKLVLIVGLLLAIGAKAHAITAVERIWAPAETLKEAPKLPDSINIIPCYARTMQKSGSSNRIVGILPFVNWGILDGVVIGGTPAIGEGRDFLDNKGVLGAGGGVSVDRILAASFPEIKDYFSGTVPGTNGKLAFAVKLGAGMVFDFASNEAAALAFAGPRFSW